MGIIKTARNAARAVKAVKGIAGEGGVDDAVEQVGKMALSAIPGGSAVDKLTGGAISRGIDRAGDHVQNAVDQRGGVRGLAQRGMDMARGTKDTRRSLNSNQFQQNSPAPWDNLGW